MKKNLDSEKILVIEKIDDATVSVPIKNDIVPEETKQQEDKAEKITSGEIEIQEKESSPIKIEAEESSADKLSEEDDGASLAKNYLVSWGYETPTKKRVIDTIIIHSSYDALGNDPYDVDGLINEYKVYGVAAHYLIDRKGNIYQLVEDQNIAYHAGQSKTPDGRTSVNYFSIGIELMNTKDDEYTKKQYSSLNDLLSKLKKDHKIKYILGHNEIAPERKTDPWNFEWDEIEK